MNAGQFLEFFSLSEPNVRIVFAGMVLLSALSGLVGTFTFLRRQSLLGDVVAHSILPGICVAFIAARVKNPLILLIGALISGWLSTYLVEKIPRMSKLKEDTAIALVLSVFFGTGIVLLTIIQRSGYGSQSGLDQFLFGRAANMTRMDLYLLLIFSILIGATFVLLFRGFTLLSFDRLYAQTAGLPVRMLQRIYSVAAVCAVALGVQSVGVVLMSALLITPAAAARFWTNNLKHMVWLAVSFSVISAVFGAAVSYAAPHMPTGPWVVVILTALALISSLFGMKRGALRRFLQKQRNAMQILKENTLKSYYYLSECFTRTPAFRARQLSENTGISRIKIALALQLLAREGLVGRSGKGWLIHEKGRQRSIDIVRKHRLWESYLARFMHLKPDHVHEDAEGIEHIITAEIEQELMRDLDFPTSDPHDMEIPRIHKEQA